MKLDVEHCGCQIIQDICETFCHSLECFSEFLLREKRKKKRKKSKEKSYEVWETLSAPPDFVSLKGGGVILCSGGLVLVRGATAIVK